MSAAPAPAAPQASLPALPAGPSPVDVGRSDQSADLSEAEAATLGAFAARFPRAVSWTSPIPPVLARLFGPICEVLTHTEATMKVQTQVLGIMAHEMHRRQRTYWGWTAAEWAETLGPTERQFDQRYHLGSGCRQQVMAVAYLVGHVDDLAALGLFDRLALAQKVFGATRVDRTVQMVLDALAHWGYSPTKVRRVRRLLCELMLANHSAALDDLSVEFLHDQRTRTSTTYRGESFFALSQALVGLGLSDEALRPAHPRIGRPSLPEPPETIAPDWVAWCQRWQETSTLQPGTRRGHYMALLRTGRWLRRTHPDVVSPAQWTRELAAEYVAAVDQMVVGQWAKATWIPAPHAGKPVTARAKAAQLSPLRAFFRDCQEWGWIPRHFDPGRYLAVPQSVQQLIAPNPRVIADDVWAKLVWAGLNLTQEDLPGPPYHGLYYPLEMVRAVAITWLFAGLRSDEIQRLRVGCVRWEHRPTQAPVSPTAPRQPQICVLEVPTNKTSPTFTKPVDRVVGEAIETWQKIRPEQPATLDPKTAEMVHYLFAYRRRSISVDYLNKRLIPLLCAKAGVPVSDARGRITSHRARSTIASQLFNATEPMSLFELQAWLGHRTPTSTQQYARIAPTKLARSYASAEYFQRNLRMVAVLIDQDAIMRGAAGEQPWKFYDLSHGYCTYDFFDQCPHRMACAKCSFYVPKASSQAQILEGKEHLLRLLQEIPLTDDERAAVEDGVDAFEHLLTTLADTPTPGGLTPRQLGGQETIPLRVVPESGERRDGGAGG